MGWRSLSGIEPTDGIRVGTANAEIRIRGRGFGFGGKIRGGERQEVPHRHGYAHLPKK